MGRRRLRRSLLGCNYRYASFFHRSCTESRALHSADQGTIWLSCKDLFHERCPEHCNNCLVYKMDWNCRCSAFNRCFHVPDQWGDYELVFPEKSWSGYQKFWKETAPVIITAVLLTMGALILKQHLKIEPAGSIWKFGAGVLLLYGSLCGGHAWNRGQSI